MRVRVVIGDVEVNLSGIDLTPRQVHAFVTKCASIALAMPQGVAEPETSAPMGFTAHMELDPERNLGDDLSEWFEESP
ncbi:MAG TPA: hypothetical protein VLA31_03720 [Burkholderiaceae bacterium]|nr:hypothetical protein [Burkholderiaceae bacterium]